MRFKRAQAAMEFLMTYGWAILVVLIVIAALAYLGVLNPQALVPEKCTLQPLNCLGVTSTPNGNISISLMNPLANAIDIKSIYLESAGGAYLTDGTNDVTNITLGTTSTQCNVTDVKLNGQPGSCGSDGIHVNIGDRLTLTTKQVIKSGIEGSKVRMVAKIEYYDEVSGLAKYAEGEIVVRSNRP